MEDGNRYRMTILNDVNEREIADEMVKIKYKNVKSLTEISFIIICLLIMFTSLYCLQKYRFFFSLLFVLTICALHLKSHILDVICNVIKQND